jgi:hypothetical protein
VKRTLAALALAVAVPAIAHADASDITFQTVDEVRRDSDGLTLTGILAGQSTASTISFRFGTDYPSQTELTNSCDRSATLAMNHPGRYTFAINGNDFAYNYCKLKRNQ